MPVHRSHEDALHELPGARFHSYVAPARGSTQLCAWRVEVDPGVVGAAHAVSHEEVMVTLAGTPSVLLDGGRHDLSPGDVVEVPAGSSLRLDNPGSEPAELWVTASVGLTARMSSGAVLAPPWTQ